MVDNAQTVIIAHRNLRIGKTWSKSFIEGIKAKFFLSARQLTGDRGKVEKMAIHYLS